MLQNLHVKNLALIDEIEVDFSEGLNILTGETGAGKSIILGSINLALGGKYSADMLRKGAQYGLVELTFDIENQITSKKLEALDIFPENQQIVISRRFMEGRSVCRINGESVTLSKVKDVASVLIDIHGQHEHQSLLYKKNHLSILDNFSKDILPIKQQVYDAYLAYRKLQKELQEADTDEAERLKEISFLQFEISEIQNANLSEKETEDLEEEYRQMLTGKKISEYLEEAYTYASSGSPSAASEYIDHIVRALSMAASQDQKSSELYEQAMEIESLLSDFSHELRRYIDDLSFSAERFYEIETRLNEINHLKSKYGNRIEDILLYCEKQEQRLFMLQDYDSYLVGLRDAAHQSEEILKQKCIALSNLRRKEALKLEKQIQSGLKDLNFLEVCFEIHFKQASDYSADGMDEVEFMISMNPGQPLRPLVDVASGGELSRIMLAIKSVMADKDEIETLIFDEIDVGISGRTAQKVSEKMGLIGRNHQVICITHLAQIASMADAHYEIKKEVIDNVTTTTILKLSEEQSINELARILGGAEITTTIIESAREMKKLASGLKKK